MFQDCVSAAKKSLFTGIFCMTHQSTFFRCVQDGRQAQVYRLKVFTFLFVKPGDI